MVNFIDDFEDSNDYFETQGNDFLADSAFSSTLSLVSKLSDVRGGNLLSKLR